MQSKRYDTVERQTVPATTGVFNLVVENTENHQVNYHGVRYKGRIICDFASTGDILQSGYVTLFCLPNDFITIPQIRSDNDQIDAQSMIIATESWMVLGGTTNGHTGFTSVHDFDFSIKTSRNCATGGKIIGQVTNDAGGVISLTAVLSMFETTAD